MTLRRIQHAAAALSWLVLSTTAAIASAQSAPTNQRTPEKEKSDRLFAEAGKLVEDAEKLKDAPGGESRARSIFMEACKLFEESDRLYHSRSKRLNVAECYVEIGRVATAQILFNDVADEFKARGNTANEAAARRRAEEMKAKVPLLVIDVPAASASVGGLTLVRNGKAVAKEQWGTPIPEDPGDQTIEAAAPGRTPWKHTITLREGGTYTVVLPELAPEPRKTAETKPSATPPITPGPPTTMHPRRVGALITGGLGAAFLGVGSIFGALALSQNRTAWEKCPAGPRSCSTQEDTAPGNLSRTSARVADAAFILGGAGFVAGVTLWFTAPSQLSVTAAAVRLSPSVGTSGRGLLVTGAF